jgi:hypothetical protein
MKFIAKIIFKLHRKIYGYPARSEVRLAVEYQDTYLLGLSSTIGMLYICGEDIEGIQEWTTLSKEQIKEELNDIVSSIKL